jgi:hypothetical protein
VSALCRGAERVLIRLHSTKAEAKAADVPERLVPIRLDMEIIESNDDIRRYRDTFLWNAAGTYINASRGQADSSSQILLPSWTSLWIQYVKTFRSGQTNTKTGFGQQSRSRSSRENSCLLYRRTRRYPACLKRTSNGGDNNDLLQYRIVRNLLT